MSNLSDAMKRKAASNVARVRAAGTLRDSFRVSDVDGSELVISRDGSGDFLVFSATGALLGGFSPETVTTIATVSIEIGIGMPVGDTMISVDGQRAMLARI